jgi:hypothetical protein
MVIEACSAFVKALSIGIYDLPFRTFRAQCFPYAGKKFLFAGPVLVGVFP